MVITPITIVINQPFFPSEFPGEFPPKSPTSPPGSDHGSSQRGQGTDARAETWRPAKSTRDVNPPLMLDL